MTTIFGRKDLSWKGKNLIFQGKTITKIVSDKRYPEMYWIHWPDKSKSQDFYNITRAKEHAMVISLKEINGGLDLKHPRMAIRSPLVSLNDK